ncbi:unnamed protein product [Ophioblennius macclurei]
MDGVRELPKRVWDVCHEIPQIEDDRTPWKLIKLLKFVCQCVIAVAVFGLALCSKTSFLLLITLSNEGTKVLLDEHRPVALLCIGCSIVAPSVLLLLKSIWKLFYKSAKLPSVKTLALVLFFDLLVSGGTAILTIAAMPHLDIVTNITILNGVAALSALLQVASQCYAKERNCFLAPSIIGFILILLGYALFVVLYVTKAPTNTTMLISVGLAVGASCLVSLNWWEIYLRPIGECSGSVFLKALYADMQRGRNMLYILSSLARIAVTACVLGAYMPLSKLDWDVVRSIPGRETRIIAIVVGVQLVSSLLCYMFSLMACKMHAVRSCFILPLYLASLAVVALLVVPVIVYYEDFRRNFNGDVTFASYCGTVVDGRILNPEAGVFPDLVLDVTHTLCFLDMSKVTDIGLLTGSAASWWLGLVLTTVHLWYLSLYRIQRTQNLFIKGFYEGGCIEQSLLLGTRFDVQTSRRPKRFRQLDPVTVYLCATMWHETYDEMSKIIISIFRLDRFRPKQEKEMSDVNFEGHVYFDDAFKNVPGSRGRHVNEYAEMLVQVISEVYSIFVNMDRSLFRKQQQIPDQTVVRTPYGGRLVVTMPHGNTLTIHFKDKELIRHKKRWSQVMYLYYLLGWKVGSKYYQEWWNNGDRSDLRRDFEKEKHNTYLLALDGDTDFQPAAVMLLVDRLKLYSKVGAACGRIHPTGSGPLVWYQKFEYAVGHWLHKTAEHVIGCVLCSPGCFSLFRAAALMDDNVMKKYTVKASEAQHYIQYDQGEDRWLCTLLLKQGWRVEYNAASDAYTNAPEEFKEFYNQRRRWGPSTMANIADLLGSSSLITKRNESMSKPYMFYQLLTLGASILSPSTVVLMITGCLTVLLNIHPNSAMILAVIPPVIFLAVSFKLKSDTQIKIAAVMSALYAFLMLIAALVLIGLMVQDGTILTPGSLFIITLACFYFVTALLHPQEVFVVVYGLLYIICIPSAYLLLAIYSMVNMNNVSWGTRETAPAPGAVPAAPPPLSNLEKAKNSIAQFCSSADCCRKCRRGSMDEPIIREEEDVAPINEVKMPVTVQRPAEPVFDCPNQCWVTQLQSLSENMYLEEETLHPDEVKFFKELITRYLEPLPVDKKKQQIMTDKLKSLRNKISFVYFICNAFWLLTTFVLQMLDFISIQVPKLDSNLQFNGEYIFIEPVGFMFIFAFALLVLIQFVTMLYHRMLTMIHYFAYLDTESISGKKTLSVSQDEDGESDGGSSSGSSSSGYGDGDDDDDYDGDSSITPFEEMGSLV